MSLNGSATDAGTEVRSAREQLEQALAREKAAAQETKQPKVAPALEFTTRAFREDVQGALDTVILRKRTILVGVPAEDERPSLFYWGFGMIASIVPHAAIVPYAEYTELVTLRKDVDDLAARNAAKSK